MSITNIFWFRRDLRLDDNAALYHALKAGKTVRCLFVFDREILDELAADDRRIDFIWQSVVSYDRTESHRQRFACGSWASP
jgi:deoxyribodipyrimidine photo-lyase